MAIPAPASTTIHGGPGQSGPGGLKQVFYAQVAWAAAAAFTSGDPLSDIIGIPTGLPTGTTVIGIVNDGAGGLSNPTRPGLINNTLLSFYDSTGAVVNPTAGASGLEITFVCVI